MRWAVTFNVGKVWLAVTKRKKIKLFAAQMWVPQPPSAAAAAMSALLDWRGTVANFVI